MTHTGTVKLSDEIILHDVYYCRECCFNLVSVSKLTAQNKCVVSSHPDYCTLQEISIGKSQMIGKTHDGLYLIGKSLRIDSTLNLQNNEKQKQISDLWHNRLGHAPQDTLRHLDAENKEVVNLCLMG